ncbi:hypothetical protein [Mesoterricola sediminis]|uniref:Uncharacterized protein n=1 Tax=Mesoterricola sediminis TaxID=2927980 RepID=A0AA48KDU7_9BACT|nr:hypothetical protein [Mesoterricola sediminis]BDU77420.1 hypothetical protein METESE_23780 [Mesoterricola sediminis]
MCRAQRTPVTGWFFCGLACVSGGNLLPMLARHGWLGTLQPGLLDFFRGLLAGAGVVLLIVHLVIQRRQRKAGAPDGRA